jgi:cell division protein FtsQ
MGRAASYLIAAGVGLFAAFGVAGLVSRFLAHSSSFALTDVHLSGLSHATRDDLLRLGGVAQGQGLFTLDLDEIEKRISRHPWVRSVSVTRDLPHGLRIDVREWVPAAIVDLGYLYLASADGEVFRRLGAGDDFDLPVITGIPREAYVERRSDVEEPIRDAIAAIAAFEKLPLASREPLSEVHVDGDGGFSLRLGKDSFTVKLGVAPFTEQLARLSRLAEELSRGNARAQVIHLEERARPGWVAVRFSKPGAFATGR